MEPERGPGGADAAEDARRQDARYRTLAAAAFEGIFVSEGGRIVEANDQLAEMFGYAPDEFVGMQLLDLVAPEDRERVRAGLHLPARAAAEYLGRRKDGALFPVEVRARTLGCAEHPQRVTVLRDITERRRVEDALREADRRKDEFVAVLSHELRGPLSPILNAVHLLERGAAGERAESARATIRRKVSHLARLIDDLLDVTRIAHGKIALRTERMDLSAAAAQAVVERRAAFVDKGIALDAALGDEALWVEGDAVRLAQVIGNLLDNAAKFTPRGGLVRVALRREGDEAALRVCDTGVGIPSDLLGSVFEPFAQAMQPLDRAPGGLGLGLCLVKGIAELHGGRASAASEGVGCGAELIVRLPLAAPAAAPAPAPAGAPVAAARAAPCRRVLVIEDDCDTAATLSAAIADMGHAVRVAHDGEEGLAAAREGHHDVIFCDIGLPRVNGYDVARALRADAALAETRLVALTAYAQLPERRKAAAAGFDLVVAKPASLDEIEEILARG